MPRIRIPDGNNCLLTMPDAVGPTGKSGRSRSTGSEAVRGSMCRHPSAGLLDTWKKRLLHGLPSLHGRAAPRTTATEHHLPPRARASKSGLLLQPVAIFW